MVFIITAWYFIGSTETKANGEMYKNKASQQSD